MLKKNLLLLLVLVLTFTLVSCKPTEQPELVETGVNDDYTLLLQSSEMDGVFNPFFYSSAYDGDVVDFVNASLLQLDANGAVVAGNEYPTVGLDYSIYYTNNLNTYAKKEAYAPGDYVIYDIVLKKDIVFSDGTPITADDVLFNYYTYLDPSYDGSSTLYTLPIRGLSDYRTQIFDSANSPFNEMADAIYADFGYGQDYVETTEYTESQFNTYWENFEEIGAIFAREIVTAVLADYGKYSSALKEGLTAAEVKQSPTLSIALGMYVWGFGAPVKGEDGKPLGTSLKAASGTVYNYDDLTLDIYFDEILGAYLDENPKADFESAIDTETAGMSVDVFLNRVKELFVAANGKVGSVPSVTGLLKTSTKVSGVDHEVVRVVLTEQNPKAILSLGVTVAPKHYYTVGYEYSQDTLSSFGVEYNSKEYMDHLKTFNAAPLGAGPYKFVSRDSGDGTVNFERNDNFEKMGGDNIHNAFIKKVAFKIVDSGAEYSALEAKSIHYATASASSDVMEDIGAQTVIKSILVDNLGYGYIAVNPAVYHNLHERIAISKVFDLAKVYEYYPNGLADVIYRSMSQVSWAYPEGAKAIYAYDETLATVIAEFKLAGYTYNDTTKKFTDVPTITFTIPSEASAHPAGGIFLKAKDLLATIGITSEVVTDKNLIANIKKSPVAVYALAWQAAADPDMYQVYHFESQAESVISNGIKWLHANGNDNDLGTIDVVKLNGQTVTMNQTEALVYLAELIEEGTKYMLAEERKPIYSKALEVLAQLAIEIPTYQRKNLFVYDGTFVDGTSLNSTVTPYWSPLVEIWKVKFAKGTTGNKTIEVPAK